LDLLLQRLGGKLLISFNMALRENLSPQ